MIRLERPLVAGDRQPSQPLPIPPGARGITIQTRLIYGDGQVVAVPKKATVKFILAWAEVTPMTLFRGKADHGMGRVVDADQRGDSSPVASDAERSSIRCRARYASMMRTTIDLDEPVLRDLKRLQKEENKTLGQLVSELVASALAARRKSRLQPASFSWISRPMGARVDLQDKDAVHRALDDDRYPGDR